MFKLRIFFFLTLVLSSHCQLVKAQSYYFKIDKDSLIDVEYSSEYVRILSVNNNILYLDSNGFLSSQPVSIASAQQNNFNIILKEGGVSVERKEKYLKVFDESSVRYIGEKYVATYDGIFSNSKRFTALTYSNGTVREYGDSVLISWDGFSIYEGDSIYDFSSYDTIGTYINGQRLGHARDAIILKDHIFLLTTEGIFRYGIKTKELTDVYRQSNSIIQHFQDEYSLDGSFRSFIVGLDSKRIRVFYNGTFVVVENFKSNFTHFNQEQSIVLFSDKVKDLKVQYTFFKNNNYHCVFKSNDIYFASSNNGLFAFVDSDEPVLLSPVEFNSRSFRLSQDTVYLGSVNGLYKYPLTYLNQKAQSLEYSEPSELNLTLIGLILLGMLILTGFIALLVNVNKRIDAVVSKKIPKELTKAALIEYIGLNIRDVTIASLCNEFNLNQKELYNYFPHSTPGSVIKEMRLHKAKNLFDEGKSLDIISYETGYSRKYLSQTVIPQLLKKRSQTK